MMVIEGGLEGEVVRPGIINFNVDNAEVMKYLEEFGHISLPLYVRPEGSGERPKLARSYKIPNKVFVTLHVGLWTFAPVQPENIEEHKMYSKYFFDAGVCFCKKGLSYESIY